MQFPIKFEKKSLRRKAERNGVTFTLGFVVGSTGRVWLKDSISQEQMVFKTHVEAARELEAMMEEAVKVARKPGG